MLQSIRDRSQGWLTTVILSLVCLAFVLWGIQSYLESSGKGEAIAKVNGHSIQQADLNATYERLRQQQQRELGADFVVDAKVEAQLKKQALNQLIMGQILANAAVKEGYRVTQTDVDMALLSIPAFRVNGQFSRERFSEVLNSMMYSEQSFIADLKTTMLVNQVRSGFIESEFALPREVEAAVKLINQKRDLGYLVVPASRFINAVKVSDAEALAYYQQNKEKFATPEQVSIEYIELSLAKIAANVHFTDAQLKQAYQENLGNYTRPVRWHVAHILVKLPEGATSQEIAAAKNKIDSIAQRIRAGESFAKLAESDSDDHMSAKNGGELDWFSPGMIDPSIEKVVVKLKQPGEVSEPTRTKYGFSLLKLLDEQKPEILPFEKVRAQVEKTLSQQQAEREFANSTDKLSNLTYSNPGSLDVAAKELGVQVKTTDFFERTVGQGQNNNRDQVTANPKVLVAAFNPEVLQGNNSDVIDLNPSTLIVLRMKQHKPASLKPFAAVRNDVMQELKKQAAEQKARAVGEDLLQHLRQGNSGQSLAKQANLTWQTVSGASRYGKQASTAILNAAFHVPRPTNQGPSTFGFRLPNGDYAVLAVTAVQDGDFAKTANRERQIYAEELQNGFGQLDYALYVQQLISKAKVVTKDQKA